MKIILAGYEINVDPVERSKVKSQQTGHEIEHIKVNAIVSGEELNKKVIDYLEMTRDEGIDSLDGQITKKWKLSNNSYSYSNDKKLVEYTLDLEEMEEIKLEKLIIDDLELIPYMYEERFSFSDSLSAKVRARLSETQLRKIKELDESSFAVIRQGINQNPRQMQLILNGWSKMIVGSNANFRYMILMGNLKSPLYCHCGNWLT